MLNACLALRNISWNTLKIYITKRSARVFTFRWGFLRHLQCQQTEKLAFGKPSALGSRASINKHIIVLVSIEPKVTKEVLIY